MTDPSLLHTFPHLVMAGHYYDNAGLSPAELLQKYHTSTGWAEAVAAAGFRVTVLQRFSRDDEIEQNGVRFRFLKDKLPPFLKRWQVPFRLHREILSEKPDVVHLHSLYYGLQGYLLRKKLEKTCAIAYQDHGGEPTPSWRRGIQRQTLQHIDGCFFAADELGQAWVNAGIVSSEAHMYTVMEGSTHFAMRDREAARKATGCDGDPVFLWVGRLNQNKDPLTVLTGFEAALEGEPGAKLYMIYHTDDLIEQVVAIIQQSPALSKAVTLLGYREHHQLEAYYNSADYFLLGSHREGSGYALCEALACGVVPIVTDIPSFRMMTDQGNMGALWQVGQSSELTRAIRQVIKQPVAKLRAQARSWFEQQLSFPAIGRQAAAAYQEMITQRRRVWKNP